MNPDLDRLTTELRSFAQEREWEPFHSPKNLAAALTVEASELLEHFQWLTEAQSRNLPVDVRGKVAEEIADVFLYLLQLTDKLGIDLIAAADAKIAANAVKYPIERSRGTSRKYSEL